MEIKYVGPWNESMHVHYAGSCYYLTTDISRTPCICEKLNGNGRYVSVAELILNQGVEVELASRFGLLLPLEVLYTNKLILKDEFMELRLGLTPTSCCLGIVLNRDVNVKKFVYYKK